MPNFTTDHANDLPARCASCGAALSGASPTHVTADGRPLCATCFTTCTDCGRKLTWGQGRFLPSGGRRICLVCDDRRDRAERQAQSERTTPSLRFCQSCGRTISADLGDLCLTCAALLKHDHVAPATSLRFCHCGNPLANRQDTECLACWEQAQRAKLEPQPPTEVCAYCGGAEAICYRLTGRTDRDGNRLPPLFYCGDCTDDLVSIQARALKTGDWLDTRRECHAAMMTSHRLAHPSASWYLDLVDVLVRAAVRHDVLIEIDHEASGDSLWDAYPAESAALLLCHWRQMLIERSMRQNDGESAA